MTVNANALPVLALCFGVFWAPSGLAGPLEGVREIYVQEQEGERQSLGEIRFESDGGFSQYTLTWNDGKFADHFLSMRPFKCVEGPEKYWCHVPYPYENRRRVRAGDLTDLEYDLLFLWKGATDYGINMWNGVYYRLELDGDRIIGTLHEMNMDVLSAPPEPGNLRPISDEDLHASDAESHWLPRLVIE